MNLKQLATMLFARTFLVTVQILLLYFQTEDHFDAVEAVYTLELLWEANPPVKISQRQCCHLGHIKPPCARPCVSTSDPPALRAHDKREAARNMASDLSARDVERANFAFSIYDFEGNGTMDAFFVGEALRGLNFNPTLSLIEKLGGTKKKKEKILKSEDFLTIFAACKKEKEMGSYEDFLELLKLYDKAEDGTMHLAELEHILLSIGERLEPYEAKVIIGECADEEDEDGLIPYVPFIKKLVAGPFPDA